MNDNDIIEKLNYLKQEIDGIKNNNIEGNKSAVSQSSLQQPLSKKVIMVLFCIVSPFVIYYSFLNLEPDFIIYEERQENSHFMKKSVSYFFLFLYTVILWIILCLILYYTLFFIDLE